MTSLARVTSIGRVVQISSSSGGVPKRPVLAAIVTRDGITGDWQDDRRYHGGPDRAVSIFSLELIEKIRSEGHPIGPGTTGENLTVEGIDWALVRPGVRLRFAGGVLLEVTSFCSPCGKIRGSFLDGDIGRLSVKTTGESRVYSRVLATGSLLPGETFTVEA